LLVYILHEMLILLEEESMVIEMYFHGLLASLACYMFIKYDI